MVRPSGFAIRLDEPEDACKLPVTVVDTTFYGPVLRVTTRTADGITLGVQLVDDRSVIRDGTTAWLTWPLEDAALIPGRSTPGLTQESLDTAPADAEP